MSDLTQKDWIELSRHYKYFQTVKETMVKEVNEAMKAMFHQMDNINKEKKPCLKKWMEWKFESWNTRWDQQK